MSGENIDSATVEGFGEEWAAFDQSRLVDHQYERWFEAYFGLFPFDRLTDRAEGFDLGCGSGRWALGVAPKVGILHCVDPAQKALDVARRRLADCPNVRFHHTSASALPFADGSQDFGYSLGVLHHIPDTARALADAVSKLKPGAPFLLYLYYALENRPGWYRAIWRATDRIRNRIAKLPFRRRRLATDAIALGIYWPLSRIASVAQRTGADVSGFPLSAYRGSSIHTLRTDALDRFGTPLEHRFTRRQIESMMTRAGLADIRFSEGEPYWVACGIKRA